MIAQVVPLTRWASPPEASPVSSNVGPSSSRQFFVGVRFVWCLPRYFIALFLFLVGLTPFSNSVTSRVRSGAVSRARNLSSPTSVFSSHRSVSLHPCPIGCLVGGYGGGCHIDSFRSSFSRRPWSLLLSFLFSFQSHGNGALVSAAFKALVRFVVRSVCSVTWCFSVVRSGSAIAAGGIGFLQIVWLECLSRISRVVFVCI